MSDEQRMLSAKGRELRTTEKGILDDYLEIQMMVKKLPKYLVDRWKREVDKWLYDEKGVAKRRHPPFSESQVREVSPLEVLKVLESDFQETGREDKTALSIQDQQFVKKMSEGLEHREDGHFQMPLPLKNDKVSMPNNKTVAMQRLKGLKAKLVRNEAYRHDYTGFMAATLEKGYAEKVPSEELELDDGRTPRQRSN
ncbi:uncharacterized protein LOC122379004 [Amphibalanus amphitrite]|uniref:uncharacterized protein LOC122379004 n=1 Tax=Amphibalanus amphitrite TaxID=1232801 RepID=UPI001C904636|nr:uncharacterized protein LOC122379004 [Amphibalanus amphitrite]